jgi:hypothetical protein
VLGRAGAGGRPFVVLDLHSYNHRRGGLGTRPAGVHDALSGAVPGVLDELETMRTVRRPRRRSAVA